MKLPPALALLLVSCCSTCAEAEPVGDQLVGIDAHLIFARGAAEAGHVDDVRHGLEVFLDHPVFERFQLHHVVLRIGAVQREEVDLADRAPVRAHLRLHARGQGDLRQPLQHPLAVPVVVWFVVEDQLQIGQAEERERPQDAPRAGCRSSRFRAES